ncbi:MAG: hypothetical protein HQK65_17615 [Desulfamplus sp.]|nr:hypothetical protein [Desulfamplus sp.]
MGEREYLSNIKDTKTERSSKDIRQDIAEGEEIISRTVDQIGERIREKLDWREYVKDSPYLATGAAAGIGFLAAGMLITRKTPMERIMGSIAEEVRGSLRDLHVRSASPGLIRVTLLGIATKAAVDWIKKAVPPGAPKDIPKDTSISDNMPQPET